MLFPPKLHTHICNPACIGLNVDYHLNMFPLCMYVRTYIICVYDCVCMCVCTYVRMCVCVCACV